MTSMTFRNLDLDPMTPVALWPPEAIVTALDRGSLVVWRRLAAEIRRSPWGALARTVDEIAAWGDHASIDLLMRDIVAVARAEVTTSGRRRWADHIAALRRSTGLSLRAFAALAGTSAPRLSDYERAKVAPTTDVVGRLEHAARTAVVRADADGGTPPRR